MPYDPNLATRIWTIVGRDDTVTEKKMFGGLAFLLDGKMFCGITGNDLMVRVGPERHPEALAEPHVRPMDFTGKPMKGYVFVGTEGIDTDASLRRWVEWGMAIVRSLPAKRR